MKKITKIELHNLFFDQISTLRRMGYPESILKCLKSKEKEVMKILDTTNVTDKTLLFIPVVPEKILPYSDQANLISGLSYLKSYLEINGQRRSILPTQRNAYAPTYSREPYYIVNITFGQDKYLENHQSTNHEEVMALGVHTNLLKSHRIAATACSWEGMETAIITEADYCNGKYPVAEWENIKAGDLIAFCKTKIY